MTHPSLIAVLLALVIGSLGAIAGGALGGIMVGGKALGHELAAMMGGFYGPLAAIPGLVLGLLILALVG